MSREPGGEGVQERVIGRVSLLVWHRSGNLQERSRGEAEEEAEPTLEMRAEAGVDFLDGKTRDRHYFVARFLA